MVLVGSLCDGGTLVLLNSSAAPLLAGEQYRVSQKRRVGTGLSGPVFCCGYATVLTNPLDILIFSRIMTDEFMIQTSL